jgi:hypothetical protein
MRTSGCIGNAPDGIEVAVSVRVAFECRSQEGNRLPWKVIRTVPVAAACRLQSFNASVQENLPGNPSPSTKL